MGDRLGWVGMEREMGGTFKATSTACVLLTIPTTTLPCLTASDAYSTWNIRPCGELQMVSPLPATNSTARSYSQSNRIVVVVISEHLASLAAASAACVFVGLGRQDGGIVKLVVCGEN